MRVKKSIGALSTVVDEELAALRAECASLREEVQRVVDLAKSSADGTVNLIGESRRRDTEWMQLTFNQVKDAVAKLDADVKESRATLFELSNAHASAVARLGADADTNTGSLNRQVTSLVERMAVTEGKANSAALELGRVAPEVEELVRWSKEAGPQLAGLKGFESVQSLTESVHAHTAALQQRQDGVSQQLAMASEEISRHRDAIVLMVETVDSLSRDARAAQESQSTRVSEIAEMTEQRGRLHEKALASLSAECGSAPDALRRAEARLQEQQEAANLARLSGNHQADAVKGVEREILELKQEVSQNSSQLRSLKAAVKDANDGLNAFKVSVRRTVEDQDARCEKLSRAVAIISSALKIANPLLSGGDNAVDRLAAASPALG